MDSFFIIIIMIAVIVIILSITEKFITRNLYQQRYRLKKGEHIKIKVPGVPLPCYVYYTGKTEFLKDIPEEIQRVYEKRLIPIHISCGVQKQLKRTWHCIEDMFTVGDPINGMINTVSTGFGVVNASDPTQSADDRLSWKIYKPIGYHVRCFIDKHYLYIM